MSSSKLEHEGNFLGRVHAKSNYRKALAYWLGFLNGVLASDDVQELEVLPLATEAQTFLGLFGPQNAENLVGDLTELGPADRFQAFRSVEAIISRRSNELIFDDPKDEVNQFFGFCAGIACDNKITPGEVERLLAQISPTLLKNDRIASLRKAALLSIQDGQITPEESQDICEWISKLVGDSAADTGVATFGNVGIVDGAIDDPKRVVFDGRMFVLTGKFEIGPRKAIATMISDRGGRWKDSVCGKTDYLAIAVTASKDWKHSHEGLKIIHAMDLRKKGGLPNLVVEHTLSQALSA